MAALQNAKHERFAQAVAKGHSLSEAYELAGYKPHDGNASTLRGNQKVTDRIAELLERAAIRTEITVAGITDRLLAIAAKGEAAHDAPLLSVARASLMDAAKLNGLITDKAELSGKDGAPLKLASVDLSRLTPEQLTALAAIKV